MSEVRRRQLLCAVAVTVVVGLLVIWCATANSASPRWNLPYIAWKSGLVDFRPQFARMIQADRDHWEGFVGHPVSELEGQLDLKLCDGTEFPLSSYRGRFSQYNKTRFPQNSYYFFDDDTEAWGWCAIVVDGRVTGFTYVRD